MSTFEAHRFKMALNDANGERRTANGDSVSLESAVFARSLTEVPALTMT